MDHQHVYWIKNDNTYTPMSRLSSLPSLATLMPHVVSASMYPNKTLPFLDKARSVPAPEGLIKPSQYQQSVALFGSQLASIDVAYAYNGTFVRPRRPCYSYQFEQFFGFGCGNLGFNTEVTRFLPYTYVYGRNPEV